MGRLLVFIIAIAACGSEDVDVERMCRRVGSLTEIASSHAGSSTAFDYARCEREAKLLASKDPRQLACLDKCAGHFGLGEFKLCSSRCKRSTKSNSR